MYLGRLTANLCAAWSR